jgi:uncharacterized protein YyaL (SSP411 family)
MATSVLLRLAALTGDDRLREAADSAIATVAPVAARYPTAVANWLSAIHLAVEGIDELAIVGSSPELIGVAGERFRPNLVVAVGSAAGRSSVPLLAGRELIDGRPTAYLCRNFACRLPVTDPDSLRAQLESARPGA